MPSNSFEDKLLLLELFVNIAKFSYVAMHSQQGLQTHKQKYSYMDSNIINTCIHFHAMCWNIVQTVNSP